MNGENLKLKRKKLKLTQTDLANQLGVSMRTVQNWEGNINSIPKSVELYFEKHTDISHAELNTKTTIDSNEVNIPYYDVDFAGGWSSEEMFSNRQPDFFINNPEFNRCDFACNLNGKSVSKIIPDKSIVGFKIIEDWQTYFPQNELYGIITKNDFRTVKLISKTRDGETLILKPQPAEEFAERYKDQEEPLPVSFVTKFLQVVAYACFERIAM